MEEEIGRIKKSDAVEIVIKVDDYDDKKGVTIREFATTGKYTGFTKSGTKIPMEKWQEFKDIINRID